MAKRTGREFLKDFLPSSIVQKLSFGAIDNPDKILQIAKIRTYNLQFANY